MHDWWTATETFYAWSYCIKNMAILVTAISVNSLGRQEKHCHISISCTHAHTCWKLWLPWLTGLQHFNSLCLRSDHIQLLAACYAWLFMDKIKQLMMSGFCWLSKQVDTKSVILHSCRLLDSINKHYSVEGAFLIVATKCVADSYITYMGKDTDVGCHFLESSWLEVWHCAVHRLVWSMEMKQSLCLVLVPVRSLN